VLIVEPQQKFTCTLIKPGEVEIRLFETHNSEVILFEIWELNIERIEEK